MTYKTYDGVPVVVGLRVFTNDWEWGTVVEVEDNGDVDGWHLVRLDSGPSRRYNRDRMTTRKPQ